MGEHWTLGFHTKDETEIEVSEEEREDGEKYYVVSLGPNMRRVHIFATPIFMERLQKALGKVPARV